MTRTRFVVGLLVLFFATMPRSWATDVALTLQPDGDARLFEYFSDAFAQLDRGFNNNPALDGFYLISVWETSGGTNYQQVGSGADVFVVQNPCPSGSGCTESNWVDLGALSYNGSGDGTFPITGLDIEFNDVITGQQLVLSQPYTTTVNSVSGNVTISGGQITGINLTSAITFNLDGTNFGQPGSIPFNGVFTINGNRFALDVDDTFEDTPPGLLPYRLVWEVNGSVVPGQPPQTGNLALSSASYSTAEDGGSLTVTVNRNGGSDGAASVSYATGNGTATAPADYTSRTGSLNWADGDGAPKSFNVPIVNDSTFEGDETFSVTLSNAMGAGLVSPSSATVTIIEDDVAQTGNLALSSASYSTAEDGGSLTVTVNRNGGSDGAASVSYATGNGTATAPADYTSRTGSLNWADGDGAPKSFNVPIVNDSTFEGDETFSVTLSNAMGAGLVSPSSATVTIIEDDSAPAGVVRFRSINQQVEELTGLAAVEVERTGGSNGAVSVNYSTADGTATNPEDYLAVSGTLNWPDGEAGIRTFDVVLIDDQLIEGVEFFEALLSGAAGGAAIDEPSVTLIEILDDNIFADGFEPDNE